MTSFFYLSFCDINGAAIATDFDRRLALRLLAAGAIDFSPLKGANLACTCALGWPCHADVQLDLSNR